MGPHAYPRDLAAFVAGRWDTAAADNSGSCPRVPLPPPALLEGLLSTCYQASLLREEERPVTFRAILCPPELIPPEAGPPTGLHRLALTGPRPYDEDELRRLSPSADFHRSLIGLRLRDGDEPEIWGLISSGPRWIQAARGGRVSSPELPDCPVLSATGPGRIVVARGSTTVAALRGGRITCPASDVLESRWLQDAFADVRAEILALHHERAGRDPGPRRPVDPQLVGLVGRHFVRRALSVIRAARHGATLLILPPETAARCEHESFLNIKYHFADDAPRRRFRALILEIIDMLTREAGAAGSVAVGWAEYLASRAERLGELDEAVAELAHLLASLSAVDGAVVLTRRFEILGFGAEISGELPHVEEVDRALDADARETARESTAGVGTRHRSVYRLCQRVPEVLAVVVSQDGGVRFVKRLDGHVAYWDQVSTGVREL